MADCYMFKRVHPALTLAVCPVIGDEGDHIVGRPVSRQTGAVVAAIRVVASCVLPTDLHRSYLTFILI